MSSRRQDRNLREIRLLFPHAQPARSSERFAPEIEDAIRIVHPAIPWIPRRVNIAAPAAGAEFSFFPPAGVEWRLVCISGTLTTDANVATRQVRASLRADGATVSGEFVSPSTQTASQSRRYTFAVGVAEQVTRLTEIVLPLPIGITLVGAGRGPGFELRLETRTNAFQATDQWSVIDAFVLERLNVALR